MLLLIGLGLHIAGIATIYWEQLETIQENTIFSVGLWKAYNCSGGHNSPCGSLAIPTQYKSSSFTATQAMECFCLVLLAIVAVVACFYVASERYREMSVAIAITVICFITAAFGVIAMIIWLAQIPTKHYPGYSFGLCVASCVMAILAGILMIPDIRKYQNHGSPIKQVRPEEGLQVQPVAKYDEMKYDQTYNRKFTPETPHSNVRHYYNPNRDPYAHSPPPTYHSYQSPGLQTHGKYARTDIQTPDVYLGRDARNPRKY